MANYLATDTDLTSVANAIRTKGGTSAQMAFPAGFVSAVQAIPTGTTPTGTKQIAITQNGTVTEDVAAYANAEITVNVPSSDALISPTSERIWFPFAETIVGAGNSKFSDYQMRVFYASDLKASTTYTWSRCNNLQALILPALTSWAAYSTYNARSPITAVDLSQQITFQAQFDKDSCKALILRSSTLCPTSFTTATWGINAALKIYVPSALRADYLEATNWSTFGESRILAIEGSEYEDTDWWRSI